MRRTLRRITFARAAALVVGLLLAASAAHSEEKTDALKAGPVSIWFDSVEGLRAEAFDGNVSLRVGGRIHVDAALRDPGRDHVALRRLRGTATLTLFDDFRFRVDREFKPGESDWRALWAEYRGIEGLRIRGGNFIAPLGMGQQTSSNDLVFLERSLSDTLSPGYQTGVQVHGFGRPRGPWGRTALSAKLGGFVEPLNDSKLDAQGSNHASVVGRVAFAPYTKRRRVVHLATAIEYRDLKSGSSFRYRETPSTHFGPALLRTPTALNGFVRDVRTHSVEAAWANGPVSLRGEYIRAKVDRLAAADPTFDGYTVEGSWFLTGEHRRYLRSSGNFGRVTPKRKFGALELGLRFSSLDLEDAGVRGGDGDAVSVALNWYLRKNLRVLLNFDDINVKSAGAPHTDVQIVGIRLAGFF